MHREPDLSDEVAEADVDEEMPSPTQQRQLLEAHVNLGHPTIGEFCRALRMGDAAEKLLVGQNVISNVQRTPRLCQVSPFQPSLWHDAMEMRNPPPRTSNLNVTRVTTKEHASRT